jgi:hypothetical protein
MPATISRAMVTCAGLRQAPPASRPARELLDETEAISKPSVRLATPPSKPSAPAR